MSAEESAPQPPTTPTNYLIVEGQQLPCFVKAVVSHGGQAAGLGIKATDPALLMVILQEEERAQQIRGLLRQQVDAELAHAGITYGLLEEEIGAAIDAFVEQVASGSGAMVTRKIAAGQPPETGKDGWLSYLLNPDNLPLQALGKTAHAQAAQQVHQVKAGDVLVERHAPEEGKSGQTVRGESVEPSRTPRDVTVGSVAGANTTVAGQKVVATLNGVYREDRWGHVRVVQDLEVEEVNAGTGDVPKSGMAASNFWVHKGVVHGFGLFTSEDVLVGSEQAMGVLEADTRIRARNLFVKGQVAGGPLPAEYLNGEIEGLEEAAQRKIKSLLEKSQIEVEGLFGARDVLNRNVSARTILVQTHSYNAALEAAEDVWVDGNLSGGVVSFGRQLLVLRDMGNAEGSVTRIRLGAQSWIERKQERLKTEIQTKKAEQKVRTEALEAHQAHLEHRAQKDTYWAALFKSEKRPPKGPFEQKVLEQFFPAMKKKKQLEQAVEDHKREIREREQAVQEIETNLEEEAGLRVVVGGTVYPGVCVEIVRPLEAADLEGQVVRKTGAQDPVPLKDIKAALVTAVNDYLALHQEHVEEQKKAQEQMFKGRDKRPQAPTVKSKRFQTELVFPDGEIAALDESEDPEGGTLSIEGELCVYSHEPQTFYVKQVGKVKDPLENVVITIEKNDDGYVFRWVPNKARLTAWQRDLERVEELDAIQVLGQTAKALLVGEVDHNKQRSQKR